METVRQSPRRQSRNGMGTTRRAGLVFMRRRGRRYRTRQSALGRRTKPAPSPSLQHAKNDNPSTQFHPLTHDMPRHPPGNTPRALLYALRTNPLRRVPAPCGSLVVVNRLQLHPSRDAPPIVGTDRPIRGLRHDKGERDTPPPRGDGPRAHRTTRSGLARVFVAASGGGREGGGVGVRVRRRRIPLP